MTISKKPVRIVVVGAGLIGKRHAQALRNSEKAQVSCIVDPQGSGADFAAGNSLDWYLGISDMLKACKPDGVIIATPNQLHVENGLECIRANLPVLIEKPIADETGPALKLVEEAENCGVPVLVGHHRRHNPIIQAAKTHIENGAIGEIIAVHASCWLYKPDAYFDVAWRRQQGAGPVFINLIHDIDSLRHLVGEVQSVQAIEASQARGHEIEDTAAIILRFANGALATVSVSDTIVSPWSWELTAEENPAYPATNQTCYFLGGTHGSMEIPKGKIWTQNGERSWWEPIEHETYTVEPTDPLDAQISHFCDVISGKSQPLVSGREGLKSLQVIEAIKKSARTGLLVPIEEIF